MTESETPASPCGQPLLRVQNCWITQQGGNNSSLRGGGYHSRLYARDTAKPPPKLNP